MDLLSDAHVYGGLFALAFVAATILPAQSEAALAAALLSARYDAVWLLVAATTGNVGGSCVNWLLGRFIERFRGRRWFPASDAALERAKTHYHRYGRWTLLLSWVPVIGDPLTVVAGVMREPLWSFLVLVTIAKAGRYLAIAWFLA
jgi:membrane protein YqaA with SNARE-associated domain